MRYIAILFLFTGICMGAVAQRRTNVISPDGNLKYSLDLKKKTIIYTVSYKGKRIINDSPLSLDFADGAFGNDISFGKPTTRVVDENYSLTVGKAKTVRDHCRETLIPLKETKGLRRQLNLVVRVYDEGVAFRYEIPAAENWKSYVLNDEYSTFNIAGDPEVKALYRENFNTSHEGYYQNDKLSKIPQDTLIDLPVLIQFPDNIFMSVTEASLRNYAGMYLKKRNGILTSQLSPWQGQTKIKVKAVLPHKTPWRVMLISDRVGALIESNIITSLNEPTRISDLSWIHPGKTSFYWWNGDIAPDTSFEPGNNYEFNKYYIDFSAKNGLAYSSVIGYAGHPWYQNNGGQSYQPGPGTDITKVALGLDMDGLTEYARSKGVGIHLWVHWKALYPKLEEAFKKFEKWGIKGMMVDFMDRDDQEMVVIQENILKSAAAHKLYIQFHGAYKPTGMHRTYPNEFTREGTYNYENNKWSEKPISPDHDLDIVFTRMIAGATDYHLGGFRAVPPGQFKPHFIRPLMVGTRCHMLAMYVVLESYLASLCDYPDAYEGQPGFGFLKEVPTTWDESRVLDAKVSKYIIVARRKNLDWYIGAITNSEARDISIDLSTLTDGSYHGVIYKDSKDSEKLPNQLREESFEVKPGQQQSIHLAAGGGAVIVLKK